MNIGMTVRQFALASEYQALIGMISLTTEGQKRKELRLQQLRKEIEGDKHG